MMFLIASAASGAVAKADPAVDSATHMEAVYTDWLTLQPDLQYSANPSADRALQNAVAVGLRFELSGSALP